MLDDYRRTFPYKLIGPIIDTEQLPTGDQLDQRRSLFPRCLARNNWCSRFPSPPPLLLPEKMKKSLTKNKKKERIGKNSHSPNQRGGRKKKWRHAWRPIQTFRNRSRSEDSHCDEPTLHSSTFYPSLLPPTTTHDKFNTIHERSTQRYDTIRYDTIRYDTGHLNSILRLTSVVTLWFSRPRECFSWTKTVACWNTK